MSFRQLAESLRPQCSIRSLLDKAIVRPEALRVAIAGIHELEVVTDDTHDAEARILRRRNALIPGEELLHFLLFTGLRVLIDGVELVFRQTAVRVGFELNGLLRLDHDVLRLNTCGSQTCNGENQGESSFHMFLRVRAECSG
jgi:hypothetical protein